MAKEFSFDIVSEVDLQEVDNAINQAVKELRARFDFKGSKSEIRFDRGEKKITLITDSDIRLKSLTDMLYQKFSKRNVPLNSIDFKESEKAFDGQIRQVGEIIQGIPQEKAKELVKYIKTLKIKVQPSIQGDHVRISGKHKDDLQEVIQGVKTSQFSLPLQFVNYR
jgi:cyclic-di-GMP-binding protein